MLLKNYLRQLSQAIRVGLKNKKSRGLFQLFISLCLLAYFIYDVGPNNLVQNLLNIDRRWYLAAFLLFEINLVIRTYRWYILLRALNDKPSFLHLLYLYYLGFFANNFIPSGFGGDVVKIANLRQHYGRGAEALSSVIMERLTGLMGSSLVALVTLALNALGHITSVELPPVMWLIIVLTSAGIPLAFMVTRWLNVLAALERLIPATRRLPRYRSLQNLVHTVHRYPLPVLLNSLLVSLPFTVSLVLVQYFIAVGLGVDLPITVYFLFVPLISLLNLVPLAFNGLGFREGIYISLFVPVGVPQDKAVAMSLAFYFLRFFTGLIGGLLYAIRTARHMAHLPRAGKL